MPHAHYSPSGSFYWIPCPKSLDDSEGIILYPNDDSDVGIEAHKHCAEYLQHWNLDIIPPEFRDGAKLYGEVVGNYQEIGSIEKLVKIDIINERCWGRADFIEIGYDHSRMNTATLRVIDFKFGYEPINPEGNTQLLLYASGMIKKDFKEVEITIVQPNSRDGKKVKSIIYDREYLEGFIEAIKDSIAVEVKKYKAGLHCIYCPALINNSSIICPAFKKLLRTELDKIDEPLLMHETLTKLLGFISKRIKNTYTKRLEYGEEVEGYELSDKGNRMKWAKNEEFLLDFGARRGVDLIKTELVSPREAIKKGLDYSEIKALTYKERTLKRKD